MTNYVPRSTFHVSGFTPLEVSPARSAPEGPRGGLLLTGFTLIELVIATGIFLIITMIVLVSFRSGEKAEQLRFTIEDVAQQLRTVQVAARTGQRLGSSVPRGGFGISIASCDGTTTQCILTPFGDQNSDRQMTSNEKFGDALQLAKRISIDTLTIKDLSGGIKTVSGVVLIARSPYGEFQVNDTNRNELVAQELSIKFKQLDLDRTRTIVINIPSGQLRRE